MGIWLLGTNDYFLFFIFIFCVRFIHKLMSQCFLKNSEAVQRKKKKCCVCGAIGGGLWQTLDTLRPTPLDSHPTQWQHAAMTTTADHMMSWPLLWQEKHSRWYTQADSHAGSHTFDRGAQIQTCSGMHMHTSENTNRNSFGPLFVIMSQHGTVQYRWASFSSVSTGYHALEQVHVLLSAALISEGFCNLSLGIIFIQFIEI